MNPLLPIKEDSTEPQEEGVHIFEEEGTSSTAEGFSQPQQTPIKPTLLVKILNGPHEGASMEIPEEGIIVGNGDTSDLMIFDPQVAARHFRLLPYEEGKAILSPLEGETFLEGVLLQEDTILEGPTQVITAGDSHFVVGAANQEWPEVSIPTKQPITEIPQLEDFSIENIGLPEKKKEKKSLLLPIALWVAVILTGFGLYFTYGKLKASQKGSSSKNGSPAALQATNATPAPASFIQRVKNLPHLLEQILPEKSASAQKAAQAKKLDRNSLPNMPLEVQVTQELLKKVPNIVFSFHNEGGKRQFDVWTRGEHTTTAVRRILSQASPPLLYNLIDIKQLEISASTLAQLFGISLQVQLSSAGTAIWSGYQRDEASWRVFFAQASKELPAIPDHRCEIVFGNRVVAELNKDLVEQGLSTSVRAVADESGLSLEGSLPKEEQAKWDSYMAEIRKKYSSRVAIADRVNSGILVKRSLKDFFPSPVVGISASALPWVSLANGSKFFLGAKLKNGYILQEITSDSLRVSGPEGTLTFSLPTLE